MNRTVTEDVYSDPYEELPLKNDKYAGTCTDLHLGKRNITKLQGFEKFISLDTLWLNDNKLQGFEGLEENFRLKGLHLFGNRIRQLERHCFVPFKFLAVLTLNDNLLDDIDNVIREIKCLKNLHTLNLYDNPIAEEDNYRLRVLAAMPSVTTFDRHRVTDEERIQVAIFKEKMNKLKHFDLTSGKRPSVLSPLKDEEENKRKAQQMKNILHLLRKYCLDQRLFLEVSFLEEDRRKLGIVSEGKFWSVLKQFGLSDLFSDSERDLLTERYKKVAKVTAISMTGTLPRPSYNYLKFCRDMLPDKLKVIPDPNHWKTDYAQEVSVTTRALERYVNTVKSERTLQEALEKKRTMLSASAGDGGKLTNIFGDRKSRAIDCGLSPWELVELSRLVFEYDKSEAKMTREQCEAVLKCMSGFRKVPELGIHHSLNVIFKNHADSEGHIASGTFRALIGCPAKSPLAGVAAGAQAAANPAAAAANPAADKGKKGAAPPAAPAPAATASGARSANSTEVQPCIRWRALSDDELEHLEGATFSESAQMLDALLRSRGAQADVADLFNQTIQSAIVGTRLASNKARKKQIKTYFTPEEIMANAGQRSDVVVLPNLKASVTLNSTRPHTTAVMGGSHGLGHGHGHGAFHASGNQSQSRLESQSGKFKESFGRSRDLGKREQPYEKGWSAHMGTSTLVIS